MKRVLFLPALIAATVGAIAGVRQYPDRLTYAGLAVVAALWMIVALRSVILVGKFFFWITVATVLVGTYLAGPYVMTWMNR